MTTEKLKMEIPETCTAPPGFGIRHLQVLMMCACAAVIYVTRSSMGVAILPMTDVSRINDTGVEIYEWSEEIRGVVLSSFFWGYTLMQIPGGVIAKKFGGKPLLLAALIINGLLCLATPFLAGIGGWIAVATVRVIMGLTQACFMPSQHTLLGQWTPPQERNRMSVVAYAGISIGTIITMPLCGVLASTAMGWKLIFYCMGVLALVFAVLWWGFAASSPSQHRLIKHQETSYIESSLNSTGKVSLPIPWKKMLTSVPLYAVGCTHIGVNWCFIMFLVELPTYLKNGLGIDLTNSSSISALPFLMQWITATICSVLCDYMYSRKIMSLTTLRKLFNSIGSLGVGLGLIIISFLNSEQKTLAVVVLVISAGCLGANNCGYMLNHIDLSPNFGGVMYGITNCSANLIGILAPLSTGFILGDNATDPARWRIVFSISAAIIISSDLIFRFFGTSELQPWNEAEQEPTYDIGVLKMNYPDEKPQEKDEKTYSFPEKE